MPPLSQMVPVTSVDTIAAHALKMGWMEKVFAPASPRHMKAGFASSVAFPTLWPRPPASLPADCGLLDWSGIGGIVLWSIMAQKIRRPHRFPPPKKVKSNAA